MTRFGTWIVSRARNKAIYILGCGVLWVPAMMLSGVLANKFSDRQQDYFNLWSAAFSFLVGCILGVINVVSLEREVARKSKK